MTAPVTLFCALVVRRALESQVLADFSARTGIQVQPSYDPTTVLAQRVQAGERPDAVIAVTAAIAPILATGAVDPETQVPYVRSGMGLAVADGAPLPDISTTPLLVDALLAARSVAYSKAGASGIYFVKLLERLGIADEVNARATALDKGFTAEAVVDGRADLAVQQISELRFVQGVDIVGPLPEEVQQYTDFTVALSPSAADRPEARALVEHLRSPQALAVYAQDGLSLLPFTAFPWSTAG